MRDPQVLWLRFLGRLSCSLPLILRPSRHPRSELAVYLMRCLPGPSLCMARLKAMEEVLQASSQLLCQILQYLTSHPSFNSTIHTAVLLSIFYLISISICYISHRGGSPAPAPQDHFPQYRGQAKASMFPPGMQFDVVQKKWARQGMDPPFLTSRASGGRAFRKKL